MWTKCIIVARYGTNRKRRGEVAGNRFAEVLKSVLSDRIQQALRLGILRPFPFKNADPACVRVHIGTDNDKLLNTVTNDFQICGDGAFL